MAKKATKPTKAEPCKLGLAIREYLAAKKACENKPKEPAAPKAQNSYKAAEWNQYQKDRADYNLKIQKYRELIVSIETRLKEAYKALLDKMPRSLTWFVTEDERFAVALQTSDWPMDPPKLLLRENPVIDQLPPLKLQHVPG